MIIHTDHYTAFPLQVTNPNAATVRKCHKIYSAFLGHANFFTGYVRACEGRCGECERCYRCKQAIAEALLAPKSLAWEVWETDEDLQPVDLVGILRLSRIEFGCDALAHYFFFDGRLSDKTELLEEWRQWAFTNHPPSARLPDGWKALERVTVEIPSYAFALARHAVTKLGFGGQFSYDSGGRSWPVEGVKRRVKPKDGRWFDLLILGLQRSEVEDADDEDG